MLVWDYSRYEPTGTWQLRAGSGNRWITSNLPTWPLCPSPRKPKSQCPHLQDLSESRYLWHLCHLQKPCSQQIRLQCLRSHKNRLLRLRYHRKDPSLRHHPSWKRSKPSPKEEPALPQPIERRTRKVNTDGSEDEEEKPILFPLPEVLTAPGITGFMNMLINTRDVRAFKKEMRKFMGDPLGVAERLDEFLGNSIYT